MELHKNVPATKSWLCCTMLLFAVAAFWSAEPAQAQAGTGPSRETEPVVLTGSMFPDVAGDDISRMAAFRWDAVLESFELIRFQIDEKKVKVFWLGSPWEFSQTLYDVAGDEGGILDGDDELVFLFQDSGPQAPAEAEWPLGTGLIRHEIAVTNPDQLSDVRWVYLFNLTGWQPPAGYVTWDASQFSDISSTLFELDYVDRWVLEGYRVNSPCGTGVDLIDRVKARTGVVGNPLTETEEDWNNTAIYLGGIVGPVRAIRSVRGAASALNTFHHDIIYHSMWEREVTLRVHPIGRITLYLDWLPQPNMTYLASNVSGGVAVDGDDDSEVSLERPSWEIIRGSYGGLALMANPVPSPYVDEMNRYYRDDDRFDDAPDETYIDEDDSAFGNFGLQGVNFTGDESTGVVTRFRVYPLCSDTGDAAAGAGFRNLWDNPFITAVSPQWRTLGPIRNLLNTDGPIQVTQSWPAVNGAEAYRVYASDTADLPRESWTLLTETTGLTFTDPKDPVTRFYSVVPVSGGDEGDW
ncbi:MAG: hypothetical protein IFK94_07410 [Acidobacteria bacterium]|uniref:Uncharacterized protein n=1 Tax=Candidatus Polarisedimenticola svalbardensis TaxID=2886004 RepID=A0A8J7CEA3_9BACT|nr:hypothetical protein [Candidatus Polarisedimenticola svalbardensis]